MERARERIALAPPTLPGVKDIAARLGAAERTAWPLAQLEATYAQTLWWLAGRLAQPDDDP